MSIRPAVSEPTDKQGVRRRSVALLSGLILSTCALSLPGQKAPPAGGDALGVLTKMKSAYHQAKTYKGTIVMTQSGASPDGKTFAYTKTQEVQYKTPNMLYSLIKVTGTGAAAKMNGNSVMLCADGKSVYSYIPKLKQYTKATEKSSLPIDAVFDLLQHLPDKTVPGLATAPDSTVNGHAVYVVTLTPPKPVIPAKPANLTPDKSKQWDAAVAAAGKSEPARFFIDKKSYLLLRLTEKVFGVSTIVEMNGQVVNSDIPMSAFTFTPAPGSKLVVPKPQQPGGMPMQPGASGGSGSLVAPAKPH